jgi:hypothetical protein
MHAKLVQVDLKLSERLLSRHTNVRTFDIRSDSVTAAQEALSL